VNYTAIKAGDLVYKTLFPLLAAISALATLPSVQATEDARQIRWGGSARTRFEYDFFTNYSNVRQMTWMRFRPYINVEAEPGLSVYFEPQFSKAWGESTVAANSTTGTAEQNSGVTSDPSLGVHQAYINYSKSTAIELRLGRQVLSYGDELVIGALEWNNVARAFDGMRLRHESDTKRFDIFWSKLVDTNVAGSGTGDYDFLGSYNSFKKIAGIDEIDLYALCLLDSRGTGSAPFQLWTFGFRLKSKFENFDYRIETTKQSGRVTTSSATVSGSQADAEVGYQFAGARPVRLGIEGFYADSEYIQLFPTVHKWLGYVDAFSRKNIKGLVLHSTLTLSDQWKLMADIHRFYKTKNGTNAYRLSGAGIAGSNTGESYLGTEFDVVTQYDISKHTSVQGGFGILLAGHTLKNIQSQNPILGYASWETKF